MPHLNRRGLTLVELLVALVLLSIVSAALYRVLVSNQRIYQGAPVRGFITATYSLYQPAGDTSWYVGLTRGAAAIQPIVGPVLSNGLAFTFLNDTNNVADGATDPGGGRLSADSLRRR